MRQSSSVLIPLVLLSCAASPAAAQRDAPPAPQRWTVSVAYGANTRGPAQPIGGDLSEGGWDEYVPPGWFSEGRSMPQVADGDMAFSIRARYRMHPRFAVGGTYTDDDLGHASGHRQGQIVGFDPTMRTLAVTASVYPFGATRLAPRVEAGPALYTTRFDFSSRDPDTSRLVTREDASTHLGLLGGVGVELTVWHVVLTADFQHRFVPDAEYGPYAVDTETVEAGSADFSGSLFQLGIGLAL